MAFIPDEALLRLGLNISSIGYLKDGASRITEVTKYNNIGFDYKVVEDEDSKEDSKEAVTNLEEKASKKRAQHKAKRDAAWARALLFAAVFGLSAPASASILVSGLFTVAPRLSAPAFVSVPMPGLSAAMLKSSAAVPGSSVAVPGLSTDLFGLSATVSGLSAPASAFVPMPGLSAPVPPSAPLFSRLSPLFFLHYLRGKHQRPIWPQEDKD